MGKSRSSKFVGKANFEEKKHEKTVHLFRFFKLRPDFANPHSKACRLCILSSMIPHLLKFMNSESFSKSSLKILRSDLSNQRLQPPLALRITRKALGRFFDIATTAPPPRCRRKCRPQPCGLGAAKNSGRERPTRGQLRTPPEERRSAEVEGLRGRSPLRRTRPTRLRSSDMERT